MKSRGVSKLSKTSVRISQGGFDKAEFLDGRKYLFRNKERVVVQETMRLVGRENFTV